MNLEKELRNLKEIQAERKMKRMSEMGKLKGLSIPENSLSPTHSKPRASFVFGPRKDPASLGNLQGGAGTDNKTPKQAQKRNLQIFKKRVEFEQVRQIGYELALKFRHKKLTFSTLCDSLSENCDEHEEISIIKLKEALAKPPFELTDPKIIELVSRYLVEDNFEDKIAYNEKLSSPFLVVSTILRRLLECYIVLTDEEEQKLSREIRHVLSVNYRRLGADFSSIKSKQGDFCSKDQILKVFYSNEVIFSTEEFNLILVKLYNLSQDAKKFPFYEIFKVFNAQLISN